MATPSRVKIDRQGRLVVPQDLREGLLDVPGDVEIRRTPDGLLITAVGDRAQVSIGDDGLPVLVTESPVSNDEVLEAIDRDRAER